MADARDLGFLCYQKNGVSLCYKHGGNALVYKIDSGEDTTVTFAWSGDVNDVDILAYWDGAPNLTAGYNHGSGGTSGCFSIDYSGDVVSTDASEWVKIRMNPWSGSATRTFRVHFNVFGYDDDYPGSTCTVIATQKDGQTLIKRDQACGTNKGTAAATTDPCCVISFDDKGNLLSIS